MAHTCPFLTKGRVKLSQSQAATAISKSPRNTQVPWQGPSYSLTRKKTRGIQGTFPNLLAMWLAGAAWSTDSQLPSCGMLGRAETTGRGQMTAGGRRG